MMATNLVLDVVITQEVQRENGKRKQLGTKLGLFIDFPKKFSSSNSSSISSSTRNRKPEVFVCFIMTS